MPKKLAILAALVLLLCVVVWAQQPVINNALTDVWDAGNHWLKVNIQNATLAVTQSGTWTVQPGNTANTTAWKVDGSAVTQPISGTVTANAGSGTMAVSLASLADPCSAATAKSFAPISVTANTQLVAGVSAKKVYVCSINLVAGAATNVAIVEGTGSVCGTSTAGVLGGSTAATGWNFAANGGISLGSGSGTVAVTATSADALCVLVSAANQVSGGISYVQQ